MMDKDSLKAVCAYAIAAIGLHVGTMLINAEGNYNTSLPFAVFIFSVLGRIGGKNGKLTHMSFVLFLMLLVSLSTVVTHYLFPARANWYDGVMGFGIGAMFLIPMEYFIGKSKGKDVANADHDI